MLGASDAGRATARAKPPVSDRDGSTATSGSRGVVAAPAPRRGTFVDKLYRLLMEGRYTNAIDWTEDDLAFRISNRTTFESTVLLDSIFAHAKFPSFVRQLNLYGFKKLNRSYYKVASTRNDTALRDEAALRRDMEPGVFCHTHFRRGHPELLPEIRRHDCRLMVQDTGSGNIVSRLGTASVNDHHVSNNINHVKESKTTFDHQPLIQEFNRDTESNDTESANQTHLDHLRMWNSDGSVVRSGSYVVPAGNASYSCSTVGANCSPRAGQSDGIVATISEDYDPGTCSSMTLRSPKRISARADEPYNGKRRNVATSEASSRVDVHNGARFESGGNVYIRNSDQKQPAIYTDDHSKHDVTSTFTSVPYSDGQVEKQSSLEQLQPALSSSLQMLNAIAYDARLISCDVQGIRNFDDVKHILTGILNLITDLADAQLESSARAL